MIGFLDTGIDYQNPVFQHLDKTTRIAGIWDQTIQSGTPPESFDYGSHYTPDMINEALASEDPYSLVQVWTIMDTEHFSQVSLPVPEIPMRSLSVLRRNL